MILVEAKNPGKLFEDTAGDGWVRVERRVRPRRGSFIAPSPHGDWFWGRSLNWDQRTTDGTAKVNPPGAKVRLDSLPEGRENGEGPDGA